MEKTMPHMTFDAQLERIKLITGKHTQIELADFLGVRQSAVSDAKRRGKLPSAWLVILMRVKAVNPEWILAGQGPCFIQTPPEAGRYETGIEAEERRQNEEALRRLPSQMLADELVRRIATSQNDAWCFEEKDFPR